MKFYKIPLGFLFWTVLYSAAAFWLTGWPWTIFTSSITLIYLSFMCRQLYLLHIFIKKSKEEDHQKLDELKKAIQSHETHVKQQIAILQSIQKKRDISIKRLN